MGQAQLVQKLFNKLEHKSKLKSKNPQVITIEDSTSSIKCQMCNFNSNTVTEATKHVKEKHAHRCNECLKEFKSKQQLSNHVSITHKPKRAANHPAAKICFNCQKEFLSEKDLKTHLDNEHRSSNMQFKCPICN